MISPAARHIALAAIVAAATPAVAAERNFCANRPGRGTPACTLDPGRFQLEIGAADWMLDRQGSTRTDTILLGDAVMRLGLSDTIEGEVAWTGYSHQHVHDRAARQVSNSAGSGDVMLAMKASIKNPDGSGTSIALLPSVTLPTGSTAIGAGAWSAGLVVPVSFSLGGSWQLGFSPEVDAAADEDRHGRHLQYGVDASLSFPIGDEVTGTGELSGFADRDPSGHATQWDFDFSLAWLPGSLKDVQFDIGSSVGLNHDAPDFHLYAGVAKRF